MSLTHHSSDSRTTTSAQSSKRGKVSRESGLRVPGLRLAVWVAVLVTIALPLTAVVSTGLSSSGLEVFRNPDLLTAVLNSLASSGCAALGATVVALVLTIALDRFKVPGATVLRWLFLLPFLIPPFISAMSWIALFSPSGPLRSLLGAVLPSNIYGAGGVILLLTITSWPMAYLLISSAMTRIPSQLEEAARVAGASTTRIYTTITLPLLRPALMASLVLTFASNLSDFGIPALLGLPANYTTLTTLVYRFIASHSVLNPLPAASAVGTLLLTLACLAVFVQRSVGTTSAAASVRPTQPAARTPLMWALTVVLWAGAIIATVLPLLALIRQAILPAPGVPLRADTVTFANFTHALSNPSVLSGVGNSVLLALGAGLVCTVLGWAVALLLTRTRSFDNVGLDIFALLPQALPGLVVAVAWLLVSPLLGIFNTLWAILAAYVMAFSAIVVQMVRPTSAALSRSFEEAAQTAGASPTRALLTTSGRFTFPIAITGGVVVALTAVRELTISILLVAPGTRTLGVVIFNLQQAGDYSAASALAVLVCLVGILGLGLVTASNRKATA